MHACHGKKKSEYDSFEGWVLSLRRYIALKRPVTGVQVCLSWWPVGKEWRDKGRLFLGQDTPSVHWNARVGEDLIHIGRPDEAYPNSRH